MEQDELTIINKVQRYLKENYQNFFHLKCQRKLVADYI
jgi:hypothetical protein